jgi:hypothetical protein
LVGSKFLAGALAVTVALGGSLTSDISNSAELQYLTSELAPAAQYAINVPGEVLIGAGSATEGLAASSVSAMLANGSEFDWRWVTNPAFVPYSGMASLAPPVPGPAVVAAPLTSAELVTIELMERSLTVPSAPPALFAKRIPGGPALALVAVPVGLRLGRGIDSLFAIDTQKELCALGDPGWDALGDYLNFLQGGDCNQWNLDSNLELNADQPLKPSPSSSCFQGVCGYFLGVTRATGFTYAVLQQYCFELPVNTGTWIAGVPNWARNELHLELSLNDSQGLRSVDYNGACAAEFGQQVGTSIYGQPVYSSTGAHGLPFSASYAYGSQDWLTSWSLVPTTLQYQQLGSVPQTPVEAVRGNPSRQFRCTVILASGGVVSKLSDSFTELDNSVPTPKCPAIGRDEVPVTTNVYEVTGSTSVLIASFQTSSQYRNWKTLYPECDNGSCLLDLRHFGSSCFFTSADCYGWLTDPSRAADYACVYGTHVLPISSCYIYANIFDPAKVRVGNGFADPLTGADVGVQTTFSTADEIVKSLMSRQSLAAHGFQAATSLAERREWARAVAQQCVAQAGIPGSGVSDEECKSLPVFSPGSDVYEAAVHDLNAILSNPP